MKKILLLLIFFTAAQVFAQPRISYILPDIGTPDMNTYVEIIGPGNLANKGNFGANGLSKNQPSDGVRLECVNAADNDKIIFGPLVVSWDGRMISTQIFVNPWVLPNSADWQTLTPAFKIPIRVVVNNVPSNIDTFYIVKPFAFGNQPNGGIIGGGGNFGKRSRRGAMIVDSMILGNNQTYTVSNGDVEPSPGNQGFLPFVLLSKGRIAVNGTARIDVNGNVAASGRAGSGGVGGGGGGGRFADAFTTNNIGDDGGSGFTGGGGGGRNKSGGNTFKEGGLGSGSLATGPLGGSSLNGVGGATTPWFEASGGGTGHPFGTSGVGCESGPNCNNPGGYGGGSGYRDNQKGGAGGYATEGQPIGSRGGKIHGNLPVVPIAGGSGGASGNPQGSFPNLDIYSGSGGGGGGAMQIFGSEITGLTCTANGGDGITTGSNRDGGSGSGGYIGAQAKLRLQNMTISASGGTGAQLGGSGRLRVDAPIQQLVTATPSTATYFTGPTTDTSTQVSRTFTLRGSFSGGGVVDVYVRSFSNPVWTQYLSVASSGTSWSIPNLMLAGIDSVYYVVAMQREGSDPAPNTADYTYRPSLVMSQAAANILKVGKAAVIAGDTVRRFPIALCPNEERFDTLYIKSLGEAPLNLQNPSFKKNNQGFTLIEPAVFPTTLSFKGGIKDSLRIIVRFKAPASQGIFTDTLFIQNNDSSALKRPFKIYYEAKKDTAGFTVLNPTSQEIDTLDFGRICIGSAQTLTYLFKNASSIPVVFDPLNVTLVDKSNFSIAPPAKSTLAVSQSSAPISVTFAAQSGGKIQTKIYMNIAECGFKDSLIVKAEGITSDILFTTTDAQFDKVLVNTPKVIKVILKNNSLTDDALVERTSDIIAPPFSILSFSPNPLPVLLKPGETLTADVQFLPTATGDFSAVLKISSLFKIGASCTDTAVLALSGTGTDQNVQTTANSLAYNIVARCDTKLDSVRVVNDGSAPVDIRQANISGTDNTAFKIIRQPGGIPLTLAPGDTTGYYVIEFQPQAGSDGAKSAQLNILTSDPKKSPLVVELSADQRSLAVSAVPPVIIAPIPVPQTGSANFTITNNGVLDAGIAGIKSRRGITSIAPAPPQTIPAGNSQIFTATMQAATAGQLYDTLEIVYNQPCIDTQYVFVNSKGIEGSVLYTDNISYGTLSICRDSIRQALYTNPGDADVIFKSAVITGTDAGLFTILNPLVPGTVIPPNSAPFIFNIEFAPQAATDGDKTAQLTTIIEIAGKPTSYVTQLSGTRRTAIIAAPELPIFGTVELNTTAQLALTLTNTSTFDIRIDQAQLDALAGNGIFKVTPTQAGIVLPYFLKPGEFLSFTVEFTPTEEKFYVDTLRLNITSPCNDQKAVAITGAGGSTLLSVISIPDTTAAMPGIQDFTIPVYIDLDKAPASVITTGFKAEIAYDRSIFSVRKLSKGTITRRDYDTVTGEEVIEITVDNVALNSAAAFVVTELQGNVYLGGSDYTPIRFKSFVWTGVIPRVDSTKDGSLKIDGLCYEGGVRLLRQPDGQLLISVQPNPASTEAEFLASVVESGAHSLELYNAQGVKVWEQQFSNSALTGKTYSFKTALNNFADGVYTIVLKTPTKTRTKQFLIVR